MKESLCPRLGMQQLYLSVIVNMARRLTDGTGSCRGILER